MDANCMPNKSKSADPRGRPLTSFRSTVGRGNARARPNGGAEFRVFPAVNVTQRLHAGRHASRVVLTTPFPFVI